MKMVIYYEHNAMQLTQDAKVYQGDTTKHGGTNVCLPHTCTYCQNTHSQHSILSVVIQYRKMGTGLQERQCGLAQFINKDATVYEYVNLISSEWQKFSGGDPKAVSSEPQSQFCVEQFP